MQKSKKLTLAPEAVYEVVQPFAEDQLSRGESS